MDQNMTDIKTSIDPSGHFSKDSLTVQRVEKLKADKETEEELAHKNPQGLLMASFSAYIRKLLIFLATGPLAGKQGLAAEVDHILTVFKKALLQLSKEDVSQSPDYIDSLSKCWHTLLNVVHLIELLDRKSTTLEPLKIFITHIQTYPPKEEHTLGFYLTQSAGKEWLPFPVLEILHHLHQDTARLQGWIEAIDKILNK